MKKINDQPYSTFVLAAALIAAVVGAPPAGRAASVGSGTLPHHEIEVRLRPGTHELEGFDRIFFHTAVDGPIAFSLGGFFTVTRTEIDGRAVRITPVEVDRSEPDSAAARGDQDGRANPGEEIKNEVRYETTLVGAGRHVLEVTYQGVVFDTLKVPAGSRSQIPEETAGLIGEEGSYLSGETGWYPQTGRGYATFSIRAVTPPAVEAVTEGKKLSVIRTDKKTVSDWEILYPTRDVVLVAGEYAVREVEIEGVTLMAYFFSSEEDLIDSYLEAGGRYVRLYNRLIGPYPFSKFAVVENFFPTGFGMPSYTLLGRRVVRLPFIINTSLGHEVVHNWWGNSVYPDYGTGNWCEGLATYYADYRYEEQEGPARAAKYRRDVNIDYTTFVDETNDLALAEFRSRSDDATRIIGYGKCMMVFHMLKNHVGEDKFYRAMRKFYQQYRFKVAGWKDIEAVFEEVTNVPMDDFFERWVKRPGAPSLSLGDVYLRESKVRSGVFELGVTILNEGGFELTEVPVKIHGPSRTNVLSVPVTKDSTTFDWTLDERPLSLELDPDHELFRRLHKAEIPVTIRNVLADTVVVVTPSRVTSEKAEAYARLAGRLAASGRASVRVDSTLEKDDLEAVSVIALGGTGENLVYRHVTPPADVQLDAGRIVIDGTVYADSGHAAFAAFASGIDPARTVCAVLGNSAGAVALAGHKLVYYGKYGYVTFLNGERLAAGDFPPSDSPLIYRFDETEDSTRR